MLLCSEVLSLAQHRGIRYSRTTVLALQYFMLLLQPSREEFGESGHRLQYRTHYEHVLMFMSTKVPAIFGE